MSHIMYVKHIIGLSITSFLQTAAQKVANASTVWSVNKDYERKLILQPSLIDTEIVLQVITGHEFTFESGSCYC